MEPGVWLGRFTTGEEGGKTTAACDAGCISIGEDCRYGGAGSTTAGGAEVVG
jgi:hypothetical protein